MLSFIETVLQPNLVDTKVLEVAYQLFLEAPQSDYPVINLKELSERTGVSTLECRNTIVKANKAGDFPNCSLAH